MISTPRRASAQHVHIAAGLIQIQITRHRSRHGCGCATAGEPAGAAVALGATGAFHPLQALGAGLSLQALRSLRAGDALGALDRATIHPGAAGGVPDAEGVIRLHDVGIALGGIGGQIRHGGHMPLEGDAQTWSTLDALQALGAFWTGDALQPGWSLRALHALGAIGTGLALYPLRSQRAGIPLRALERTGGNPGHGRAAAQGPERTLPIAVGELG